MKVHYLQHVSYEGLGYIEHWASEENCTLSSTKFYKNSSLPKINDFDWLIVMGGPMGVHDEKEYPWLKAEKELILEAIKAKKTVIGICLGAQLIAAVLGAKIKKSPSKEIGFFPISKTKYGEEHGLLSGLPNTLDVFHWHGDMFEIPKEAKNVFKSDGCPNQAFIYKDRVLGFQFHLEVTVKSLKEMVTNGNPELIHDVFIQSERDILTSVDKRIESNIYLRKILTRLKANNEKKV